MSVTYHPQSHVCPLTHTDRVLRAAKVHLERLRRGVPTQCELQHAMRAYHRAKADAAIARKGGPRRFSNE